MKFYNSTNSKLDWPASNQPLLITSSISSSYSVNKHYCSIENYSREAIAEILQFKSILSNKWVSITKKFLLFLVQFLQYLSYLVLILWSLLIVFSQPKRPCFFPLFLKVKPSTIGLELLTVLQLLNLLIGIVNSATDFLLFRKEPVKIDEILPSSISSLQVAIAKVSKRHDQDGHEHESILLKWSWKVGSNEDYLENQE